MPDIRLDFSRVTYSGVLEIIAPVVPGGILAMGTLVLNPRLAAMLLSNPYLGYRTRIIAAVFISYVAGLIFNLLVNYTTYFIGYELMYFLGTKIPFATSTPERNLQWRHLARRFLGPELSPATDDLYFEELHKQALANAEAMSDPEAKAKFEEWIAGFHGLRCDADPEWYGWNQVLRRYFTLPETFAPPARYFLSMLHSASWAVILLMVFNHRSNWFAWMLCGIGLFFGIGGSWFAGLNEDPFNVEQMARMLESVLPRRESHAQTKP